MGIFSADDPRIETSGRLSNMKWQSTQPARSSPDCWVVHCFSQIMQIRAARHCFGAEFHVAYLVAKLPS